MLRVSDCAVVRSTTDGNDAHIACCNIDYYNSADCNFTHSNIADSDIADSDIAGFGGCFCLPRRLVQARRRDGRVHQWKVVCVR
jgi:hypothetical protein